MGCPFRILTVLMGSEHPTSNFERRKVEGLCLDARPEGECFGKRHAKNDSGNVNIIAGGTIDGKRNPHT